MKCPHCTDTVLVMAERQGVEIDYCPSCRGVWLDRGELDKLIERASRDGIGAAAPMPPQQPAPPVQPGYAAPPVRHGRPDFVDSDHPRAWGAHPGTPVRKRKSLLSEIFDFD